MAREPRVLGMVLAGGEGKRLWPLTADRAKPAVPFGGNYRLIDFVLSNLVNAGYLRICVLTQYKSHSLDRHITQTWRMSSIVGNYIFSTEALLEALKVDAEDEDSVHDMGGSIMPMMVKQANTYVYDFDSNDVPGAEERDRGYWRDVGTIDAYYDAHLDLVAVHPIFNLYNQQWPIYTHHPHLPPAKFIEGGVAQESIVGAGTIISGATVRHSVIASGVRLHAGSYVE